MKLNAQQKFFYENAGYSYDPKTETKTKGRIRCAKSFASAETLATKRGLVYEWEYDECGCSGCDCGSDDCACSSGEPHETLCCLLRDPESNQVLASLGGICGVTTTYRRVIEAELAAEIA